ncbi:glutathione S-transferase N-terminal domain-containing protein [Catenovulum sp. SM1970]|uniref:glutathione S-transferase N-terminal domain-containing protein n=1 Tax=Marinifaba aquimaris TaxID=2741323 RepID=UPI00157166EC|nr:glutathione S-transferase N-terminal domain-containing protein [Marinifaba aquimaris]NTS76811.1 glutathione S-transferase N-terminal domain-containing protein [Marinifaba aquimaris]
MQLIVGTDSTWSLRTWICAQLASIECEIKVINLNATDYKTTLNKLSQTGLVPTLVDGALQVNDSLAITEYFNECSNGALYPNNQQERAKARSLCAQMHAGFMNLRANCPFTLQTVPQLNTIGDEMNHELAQVTAIFNSAKLPFMFENAGAVDAFYAILAFRLQSYGIHLTGKAGEYQQSLLSWPLLQQAISVATDWKNTASTS